MAYILSKAKQVLLVVALTLCAAAVTNAAVTTINVAPLATASSDTGPLCLAVGAKCTLKNAVAAAETYMQGEVITTTYEGGFTIMMEPGNYGPTDACDLKISTFNITIIGQSPTTTIVDCNKQFRFAEWGLGLVGETPYLGGVRSITIQNGHVNATTTAGAGTARGGTFKFR